MTTVYDENTVPVLIDNLSTVQGYFNVCNFGQDLTSDFFETFNRGGFTGITNGIIGGTIYLIPQYGPPLVADYAQDIAQISSENDFYAKQEMLFQLEDKMYRMWVKAIKEKDHTIEIPVYDYFVAHSEPVVGFEFAEEEDVLHTVGPYIMPTLDSATNLYRGISQNKKTIWTQRSLTKGVSFEVYSTIYKSYEGSADSGIDGFFAFRYKVVDDTSPDTIVAPLIASFTDEVSLSLDDDWGPDLTGTAPLEYRVAKVLVYKILNMYPTAVLTTADISVDSISDTEMEITIDASGAVNLPGTNNTVFTVTLEYQRGYFYGTGIAPFTLYDADDYPYPDTLGDPITSELLYVYPFTKWQICSDPRLSYTMYEHCIYTQLGFTQVAGYGHYDPDTNEFILDIDELEPANYTDACFISSDPDNAPQPRPPRTRRPGFIRGNRSDAAPTAVDDPGSGSYGNPGDGNGYPLGDMDIIPLPIVSRACFPETVVLSGNTFTYPEQTITLPESSFLIQDGSIEPIYPLFTGAFVYDLHLKKWGKMAQDYTQLLNASPINSHAGDGPIPYDIFSINAACLLPTGKIALFDKYPGDSIIKYGKIGYYRAGYTDCEGVTVQFRTPATGSITLEGSLDGKLIHPAISQIRSFENVYSYDAQMGASARWYNVCVSGYYDIKNIDFHGWKKGKR